jgi:hypothetical protein
MNIVVLAGKPLQLFNWNSIIQHNGMPTMKNYGQRHGGSVLVSSKRLVGYLATELQDTGTKTQDTGQSDVRNF